MTDTPGAAAGRAATPAPAKARRGRQIMAVVLVILIALLGLSSYLFYRIVTPPKRLAAAGVSLPASDAAALEWVRSIYGRSSKLGDGFGQTQSAAPAADGSIWITDTIYRQIQHFTSDGRFLGAINSRDASAPLIAPSRITVGPDGLIYIVETTQDKIRVLSPDGTDQGTMNIPQPVSIAVSGDRIVVGAVSGFAILDATGKPIKVVGERGKEDGQFDYVHGVAIGANGDIYVTDSYNNRLSAYDHNGKRLWIVRTGAPANSANLVNNMLATRETSDTKLPAADAMQLPLGLTIDGAGRLVVADMYDSTLAVFNAKDGKLIGKYGEIGADDGQFFYPVSINYDPGRDWFLVADAMNKRIQIVRIPGSQAGGGAVAAVVNRSLAGPLRACVLPLLLLLLIIIAGVVWRVMNRRKAAAAAEGAASA